MRMKELLAIRQTRLSDWENMVFAAAVSAHIRGLRQKFTATWSSSACDVQRLWSAYRRVRGRIRGMMTSLCDRGLTRGHSLTVGDVVVITVESSKTVGFN